MVFEKRVKRKKNTAKKILDENEIKNIAVFPVSIPLVAGPSAITLSVLISKNFNYSTLDFYQKIFPLIIILFITSLIILFSNYILRLLNQTFNNNFTKNFWFNIRSFICGIYNSWI